MQKQDTLASGGGLFYLDSSLEVDSEFQHTVRNAGWSSVGFSPSLLTE